MYQVCADKCRCTWAPYNQRHETRVRHFHDPVSVNQLIPEDLFFLLHSKRSARPCKLLIAEKNQSMTLWHIFRSSQPYLIRICVSQQPTVQSSWMPLMDLRFFPFSFLMIMEAYLCVVLLLPQKLLAVSCSLFRLQEQLLFSFLLPQLFLNCRKVPVVYWFSQHSEIAFSATEYHV